MTSTYCFLRQDLFNSHDVADIIGHSEESGKHLWTAGAKFSDPPSTLRLMLDYSHGKELPDFFDTTVPVMSQRLINALKGFGVTNFDLYPVVLVAPSDDSEINGFFAINLIGTIDAIDWTRSEHRLRLGKPKSTGTIYLLPEVVSGKNAFRLVGGPGFIVVTGSVAQSLMKLNLKAVLLQPLSSYDNV